MSKAHFTGKRVFHVLHPSCPGKSGWYVSRRHGTYCGPFASEREAEKHVAQLRLSGTPRDQVLSAS